MARMAVGGLKIGCFTEKMRLHVPEATPLVGHERQLQSCKLLDVLSVYKYRVEPISKKKRLSPELLDGLLVVHGGGCQMEVM